MRNSRVAVLFGQSLELKGETDEAPNTEHMTASTHAFHFTFKSARLHWQFKGLFDNSGFSCSAHPFNIAFFGQLCQCTFELAGKIKILCCVNCCSSQETKLLPCLPLANRRRIWFFCCLINICQQTIEVYKHVTARLIPSCLVREPLILSVAILLTHSHAF